MSSTEPKSSSVQPADGTPRRLNLCLNCLQDGAAGVEVGREKGTQRDPYRETVTLCEPCRDALTAGRLDLLHERYSVERTVRRGT